VLAFWAIIIAVACYGQLHGPKIQSQSIGYKVIFCVLLSLIWLAFFVLVTLIVLSLQIFSQKNKAVLGEHRLSISDDGLIESTIYNESIHKWSGYHKTITAATYLMIYPTDGRFFYISKRRPLLEGDIAAFEAALKEKTKNA
jgi:hypothetical protein